MTKLAKNHFFQTSNALFCYLGVFAQNVCFIKKVPSLLREDFFDLSKHPQQTFWTFFAYSTNICFQNLYFWVNGELRELYAKKLNFRIIIHREIICQSWLLLTPFFNFPIVQWLHHLSEDCICNYIWKNKKYSKKKKRKKV